MVHLQLLVAIPGCTSTGDSLEPVWVPEVHLTQTAPDGTVFEDETLPVGGLYFVDNEPGGDVYIGNKEAAHGEGPVSGNDCVTATTLHIPYGTSLTFGAGGAVVDPEHLFLYTAKDYETRTPDRRFLFGGQIDVLEDEGDTVSIELAGGTECPDDHGRDCAPEDRVPQPGPYRLTIVGTFVVPLGDSEVRSATSMFTDPASGQPLCEAFQPMIDGGIRE